MSLAFSGLRHGWLLLALLALLLSTASGVTLTSQEQAIADKMIHASGQHRPFLKLDDTLVAVARARAADLGRRAYFDHVNPDGHGPNFLVRAAGYPLPDWWGYDPEANYIESIAGGRSSADDTWNDWMNSTPHRDHLLANTSFDAGNTSYGVGYAAVPGSPFTYYWVVITCPPRPEPTLAVTSPTAAARITDASVTMTGTASAASSPASIVYRLESSAGTGSFLPASGTTTWSAVVTGLQPGANTIRVRSLNSSGGVIAEVTRAITYVVLRPLTVAVAGNGSVTAGFLGTTQRELAHRYTITATHAAGWLFTGWTGSSQAKTSALTFTMVESCALTANFVVNPFIARVGGYTGLLSGAEAGLLKVALTSSGTFTGSLRYAGKTYPLTGHFAPDGTAVLHVPRPGLTALTLTLQLDVSTLTGVTATVDDAGRTSSTTATPNYHATASFAGRGRYTLSLPPSAVPGYGYGTLVIDKTGHATLTAGLPDGTKVSASGTLSGADLLSFYVPLYAGKGALSGSLVLRPQAASDLDGTVRWQKPALSTAKIHPTALDATSALLGSTYTPPTKGATVLELGTGANNGELILVNGNLPSAVTQPVTIDPANKVWVTDPALPKLSVTISAATGTYSGSFTHPATGKASAIHGAIFQRQNAGFGYFLGADQSGTTRLTPP